MRFKGFYEVAKFGVENRQKLRIIRSDASIKPVSAGGRCYVIMTLYHDSKP